MSTPAIKTKFELDGEKEYKAALTNINSGLRVLNSEMKLTSAQFGENADGVDALTKKNDVLNRQLLTQKDKVDTLKAALKQSAQTYGEADNKTNAWKVSLNNAEKELIDLEKEIKDNNTALDKHKTATDKSKGGLDKFGNSVDTNGGKTKGLGTLLDGLASKFGVNLPDGVTNSLDSFVKLDGKTAALATGFAAAATAIVAVEKALVTLTTAQAAAADEIITASYTTGMSTDAIQEYRYAAELLDVSFDTLTSSQSKMIRTMSDAKDGSAEAQEAFNKLGVTYIDTNGELRNAQDVFYDSIDALGKIQNTTERDALAMSIFGRSAQDLNPLIMQGSAKLKEYAAEAHEMGYVLDGEALTSLGNVDDALQRTKNSQTAAKNQIALEFAPALENFYRVAAQGIKSFGDFAKRSGLVTFFASILDLVSALGPEFQMFGAVLAPFITMLKPLAVVLGAIADAMSIIGNLVGVVVGFFDGTSGGYIDNIGGILSGNDSATVRAWNGAFNASGTDNWRGGITWVGENGPEKVYLPQGSQIKTTQESSGGGDVYNITIDAKNVREFNDIVNIAKNQRRTLRMGYAGG